MTYNTHNLAVGKVASKSPIKPALQTIAFYGNRTVATDSFGLIEMSADGDALPEPILMNADMIGKRAKLKKGEIINIDDLISNYNLKTESDTYPSVDVVLDMMCEKEDDYAHIIVNGKYLETILSVIRKLSPNDRVEIAIPKDVNEHKAMILRSFAGTEEYQKEKAQKARALLMPMNK